MINISRSRSCCKWKVFILECVCAAISFFSQDRIYKTSMLILVGDEEKTSRMMAKFWRTATVNGAGKAGKRSRSGVGVEIMSSGHWDIAEEVGNYV